MVHKDGRSDRRTVNDDTVLARIKYIGGTGRASTKSNVAKLSLTSNGTCTFFVSNTKDSLITGGAAFTAGQMLLTNAAFDTVKEFCDALHSISSTHWLAWPVDGMPDDPMSNVIKYRSDLQGDVSLIWQDVGLPIFSDISKRKRIQFGIGNMDVASKLPDYIAKTRGAIDRIHAVLDVSNQSNTTTSNIYLDVMAVDDNTRSTRTVLAQRFGSTTSCKTREITVDAGEIPLGEYGKRLVVRMTGIKRVSTTTNINLAAMSVIGAVESHPSVGRFRKGNSSNVVD